jgi:hypothetical protein
MKRLLIFLFLLNIFGIHLFAQNDSIPKIKDKLSRYAAYSGNNIIYPGLKVGMEYNLLSRLKQKEKHGLLKTKTHQIFADGNVGFYWNPNRHVGVYTNYGLTYRKTFNKGFQYQMGLNPIGYYHAFLPETYEVTSNWEVVKKTLPGRDYFAPSFKIGVGGVKKGKCMKSWFVNVNSLLLLHYNGHCMPLFFLEYGYRF